jgi:beta-galactosidase
MLELCDEKIQTRQTMMSSAWRLVIVVLGLTAIGLVTGMHQAAESMALGSPEVTLPPGVQAVWDVAKAYREKTPTRERVCLNGLWRWQPAKESAESVPAGQWGFFKVPGFWPGTNNYIQEDCQTLHTHPTWKNVNLKGITAAWYQREITVPEEWAGRNITLKADCLNSFALLYVDGKKAAEMHFPTCEADLTQVCRPGVKHVLSLLVVAMPLKGVILSYSDTNAARSVKGTVERRGLCGDLFLSSTPAAARFTDVKIDPSVRKGEITVSAALAGLKADVRYALRVDIQDQGKVVHAFTTRAFQANDLKAGRITASEKWLPEKLWDIHTSQNLLDARMALVEASKDVDVFPAVSFGFREFWIDGKDFYLNGSRIYLSAVPLDNAQLGARTATYEGARETMKRLQSFGINLVYTHNYGCQPGSHVSYAEILRAADDVGMLVAFSQPHFGHYDWKGEAADLTNGYGRHAEFYVRAAQNHPSVVAYSMSHNATGYDEDMNPDLVDGIQDSRDKNAQNQAKLALRAEAIVKRLDPSRIVYHHSSGNLGSMHTCNFYLNWVPVQELSDWFEHWATKGVKPVFLVEYGVPFSWDWAMYRGWYKGQRSFGSAKVPWEFCLAEWNAQFLGDRAFEITDKEKKNLRWEAGQFRKGNLWNRWDYPHQLGSRDFDERQAIFAQYITDNWRAFRTWGLSANSPWEYQVFWKLKEGVDRGRKEFKVDWENLQKPGFSPDYTQRQQWQMATDLEFSDWVPTEAAQALMRNNRPLLAYIGGKPGAFTSKDHNFLPGQAVDKQLIIINNSRQTVTCACEWSLALPQAVRGSSKVSVPTGEQQRIPLRFELPAKLAAGAYELSVTVRFSSGETQTDSFLIDVLPAPADPPAGAKIALLDRKGETSNLLTRLKVKFTAVDASADLSGYDVLIIGKDALTVDGPGPDVGLVRDGLKVIVLEQSAKVLEQRFGFRVTEYGLRQVFPRVPDHPLLAGLKADHLHDWHGEATLLPPRLEYKLRPQHGPTVKWCGIDVAHAWRCGCRGNVASVLIEKPACGDFLPIVEGGFALQYSPLLEYHEGEGMVLFCQMDVTGRTESDPAADALTRNLIRYVSAWKPSPSRHALYVGDPAGKRHLEAAGFSPGVYSKEKLSGDCVLIVGPGGSGQLADDAEVIAAWLKSGGNLLALGLDESEAKAFLPFKASMKKHEHIAAYFEPPGMNSLMVGIGPADVHNRDPRDLSLISGGAQVIGDGILAKAENANIVFCQLVPWQFDPQKQMNLKRTFRGAACLVTRLAANMGVSPSTPLLGRFHDPVAASKYERRWLEGFYLDVPEEWDDPYRFFRW